MAKPNKLSSSLSQAPEKTHLVEPCSDEATSTFRNSRIISIKLLPRQTRLLAFAVMMSVCSFGCGGSSQDSAAAPPSDDIPPDQIRPPNVLLITADDLGLQSGIYGETLIDTPNLDALAMEGTRFEVAYVAQPSCSPSRASMLTGMYSHATGQYGLAEAGFALHNDLQTATIPNLLKKAGYFTGLIGKLHVEPESSFQFDYRPAANFRFVREMAKRVDDFLAAAGDKPFFLMVNYLDPHAFNDGTFDPQVDGLPESPLPPSPAVIFPWQQTDSESQRIRTAGFYSAVQRLDIGIGLLVETLRKYNCFENTLIVFIGDNGPPFTRAKTSMYESGIRTPFIVIWPGVTRPGGLNKAMVSTVDILPTILDATGQAIPQHVQGESLSNVLTNPDEHGRTYLVAENHFHGKQPFFPQRAIRNERFKLIHSLRAGSVMPIRFVDGCNAYSISRGSEYAGTPVRTAFDTFANPPEFQLYDLANDPIEFHNLANHPDYQGVLEELKTALQAWRRDTNDPFLDQRVIDRYITYSLSP